MLLCLTNFAFLRKRQICSFVVSTSVDAADSDSCTVLVFIAKLNMTTSASTEAITLIYVLSPERKDSALNLGSMKAATLCNTKMEPTYVPT